MVRKITVDYYRCEKCGYASLVEEEIRKHEKIRVNGRQNSLDGLIVQIGNDYTVIREVDALSADHEVLYEWENYQKRNLKPVCNDLLKKDKELYTKMEEVRRKLREISGTAEGYTAQHIIWSVLHLSKSENVYKDFEELTWKQFQRVSKRLKSKYPDLYKDIKFKRKVPARFY